VTLGTVGDGGTLLVVVAGTRAKACSDSEGMIGVGAFCKKTTDVPVERLRQG